MNFFEFLVSRSDDMLRLGLEHAAIVGAAVALSSIIGVALGVVSFSRPRLRAVVLAVTGAFITIPSFALFILMLGVLGLGWKPVLVGLVAYGLLPIVRNTVTGLAGVDPAIVESARGMGLNRRQRLLQVELPLAWPVILTGTRVTTLVLLGVAAIGSIVNGPGYGDFIFRGLARVGTPVAVNLVLAGALGVVVLAILFDLFFHAVRRLTTSQGIR